MSKLGSVVVHILDSYNGAARGHARRVPAILCRHCERELRLRLAVEPRFDADYSLAVNCKTDKNKAINCKGQPLKFTIILLLFKNVLSTKMAAVKSPSMDYYVLLHVMYNTIWFIRVPSAIFIPNLQSAKLSIRSM